MSTRTKNHVLREQVGLDPIDTRKRRGWGAQWLGVVGRGGNAVASHSKNIHKIYLYYIEDQILIDGFKYCSSSVSFTFRD